MTDREDRARESATTDESRWEAAGEEEAERRHEAAERLKEADAMRYPEHDDPDEQAERAGLGDEAA